MNRDDGASVVAAYDCTGVTFGIEGGPVGGVESYGGDLNEDVAFFQSRDGDFEEGGGAGCGTDEGVIFGCGEDGHDCEWIGRESEWGNCY